MTVTTNGDHIFAWADTSYGPHTGPLPTSAVPGSVFWDSTDNSLKAFDGTYWQTISQPNINIGMQPDSSAAIDWVIEKMRELDTIKEMADKYPTVEEALKQLEFALILHKNLDVDKAESQDQ
jgi:hypothetical protein